MSHCSAVLFPLCCLHGDSDLYCISANNPKTAEFKSPCSSDYANKTEHHELDLTLPWYLILSCYGGFPSEGCCCSSSSSCLKRTLQQLLLIHLSPAATQLGNLSTFSWSSWPPPSSLSQSPLREQSTGTQATMLSARSRLHLQSISPVTGKKSTTATA